MFLYLHGFRSNSKSKKAKILEEHFREKIITPDYPIEPENAIPYLENIIKANNITGILASSLGGYYATYLSEKYNLPTVLINPSVKPYETTRSYLGINTKFSGERFEWKESHLEGLGKLKVEKPKQKNYLILLNSGDEVLDYSVALDFYQGCKKVVEEGGSHQFENLENYLEKITSFLDF